MTTEKNRISPADAAGLFRKYDKFLIVTHENPDGDAVGSGFALLEYLRQCGKHAELLLPEPVPEKYADFALSGQRSQLSGLDWADFEFVVYLDTPIPKRTALADLKFEQIQLPSLNIDHHPDNADYARWNLVLSRAAATAEILFMIFKTGGEAKITPVIAGLLLLGIVMDTGGFRFDNTSPKVLRHAAELLELKADYHHIVNEMFFATPLAQLEFQAELIARHLRRACHERLAWFYIPPELIRKYQVNMRNTEGLIDTLRALRGAEIVVIMQQHELGFKISLRSKNPKYSVGRIARRLNGGGHEMAAGGLIKAATLENAEKILIAQAEGVLNAL
ncbi:MAG: bifunctional oligoribonuclease/PAP phosphatase NrnA [Victivallaceae bacterium]|nr:bifunctional oligoribonuclease/PAP phosphatase NrnA [Victivallaceae bacterium]